MLHPFAAVNGYGEDGTHQFPTPIQDSRWYRIEVKNINEFFGQESLRCDKSQEQLHFQLRLPRGGRKRISDAAHLATRYDNSPRHSSASSISMQCASGYGTLSTT